MPDMPSGSIVMWAGSIVTIPAGFVICDGNNGTPDLRDRFIVGAGDSYNPDDSGGANTHVHDFTSDGHNHQFLPGFGLAAGANINQYTSYAADSGETDPANHLPPYYALAYIMKT